MYLPPQTQDHEFMLLALDMARTAQYRTSPNPRVGCILVKDGQIIGRGATQAAGYDHAEIQALKDAHTAGHSPQGATAYVTLEPCNHHGKTGPCSQALLAAGIRRVVAAITDPNPLTAGQGLHTLQAAGLDVTLGVCQQEASALNIGFIKRMVTGMPWVRLKVASSLDGFVALPNGQSQWLTGESARTDTHHWRAKSCAVLTGIGTVLADNPRLDVRHVDTDRQPARAIVDSNLRTPQDAALWRTSSPVYIFHAPLTAQAMLDRARALTSAGAQLFEVPCVAIDGQLRLDIVQVVKQLGQLQCNEVHLECGSQLNGSFLNAGLVDEVVLYLAPLLLGSGFSWAGELPKFTDLAQIDRFTLQHVSAFDQDTRTIFHTPHTFYWNF